MNEKFKELMGQAKSMAEETINKKISKNAELDAFAEKFAELIVKECVNVGFRAWLKDNSTVPTFPSKQIKQHFGVEE